MNRRLYIGILLIVVAFSATFFVLHQTRDTVAPKDSAKTTGQEKATNQKPPAPEQGFNKSRYPLDTPSSLWVVVNKKRPLNPADYVPADLVTPNIPLRSNITADERLVAPNTAKALEELVNAAKKDSINLTLESGYRSYNFQVNLYNRYVQQQGQAVADTQSARAGYSEHQTGLTADLGGTSQPSCNVETCYAETAEGKWLAANAYAYGFILRYPEGKTSVTGYMYEPWHIRYVGLELAKEMHTQGITTLEEFFGLPAAPSYN